MMRVPLTGDRYILIPKDLKDSEADYFNKWYEMWKALMNKNKKIRCRQ